jgi:hypothetical protein
MGWKNVKDHYRIGHMVQVREGRIAIGSGYISDLIRVSFEGKVTWGNLGPSGNDNLARYYAEMNADLGKLKELIDAPDTFERSLTVFTYDGGEILEKFCEEYEWPNITHDGMIMYENSFSPDKEKVVKWAMKSAKYGIQSMKRRVNEIEADMVKAKGHLSEYAESLALLETDFPEVESPEIEDLRY